MASLYGMSGISGAIGLSGIALESLFAYFHTGETTVFSLSVVVGKFVLL